MNDLKQHEEKEGKEMQVMYTPQNSVPKYATNVNFNKLANDNIIMTFVAKTGPEGAPASVIETVLVDIEHAKRIVEVLEGVINKEIPDHD